MKSTRRKTAKAAKVLLAAMLAAGLLTAAAIASHAADPPPAEAASAPNTGNPFENGDFRWDDNTQTYRVSGISIEVTSITKTGSSGYGGPFPYPQCLQRAWELSQQGLGGGHFPGWGAADFHYGSVVMTGNSRGIVFNDALPTSGHCAQRGNELTAWDAVRPARLILIEEKSYWEGGVYHACFAMLVDNGHASGVWDQATMGDSYVWAEWTLTGNAEVVKQSANGDITNGNACYSLEGAVYGVYDNEACEGDPVTTLTTNVDGWARAENIEAGSYWIKEIKPSLGYVLDPQVHPAQIEPGGTCTITSSEVPLSSTQGSAVTKSDNETGAASPQGGASLAFAEFTFSYYDGLYNTVDEARASGDPTRTWVLRTDEEGLTGIGLADATFESGGESHPYLVSGDALYRNSAGKPAIPLGTLVVEETAAPPGYLLPEERTSLIRYVQSGSNVSCIGTLQTIPHEVGDGLAVGFEEEIIRGGVMIAKRDAESGLDALLGNASLDGATFEITNQSARPVLVDGIPYEPGEVCAAIVAHDGIASTAEDTLPFGSYAIREVAVGEGYLLTDGEERAFAIEYDRHVVHLDAEGGASSGAYNQVKRGDLSFVKARESDQHRLAGIPFRITSQTTGESHIVVTDENGEANTSAGWNPHTRNTNANDAAVADDGSVDTAKLDAAAGVWFGLTASGSVTQPNDNLGALPYDRYTIEELRVPANENLELIAITDVVVTRDGYCIDLGTFDDQPAGEAFIATAARDGLDGDKRIAADVSSVVIDRVSYAGLTIGTTYELTARLFDKTAGAFVQTEGGDLTATQSFTAEATAGFVEVTIGPFDTRDLAGHDIVVFEVLREPAAANRVVATHEDETDHEQTLSIEGPRISTSASDGADGDRLLATDPAAAITDTVSYANLVPGAPYEMEASLMVVAVDGTASPLVSKGDPVTARTPFEPASPTGTVDVTFDGIDTTAYAGQNLVVFEKLYRTTDDGSRHLAAAHEDPLAAAQTVAVEGPRISTQARDALDGDGIVVADSSQPAQIIDTVSFGGLVPGRSYRLVGTLVLREAYQRTYEKAREQGATDSEAHEAARDAGTVTNADGSPAASEVLFSPERADGSIDIAVPFDSVAVAGQDVVVFERLFADDIEIARHEDINDARQSVSVRSTALNTSAADSLSGTNELTADKDAVITDTAHIDHAAAGTEYTLVGLLVDRATGLPLTTAPMDDPREQEEMRSFFLKLASAVGATQEESDDGRVHLRIAPTPAPFGADRVLDLLARNEELSARLITAASTFVAEKAAFDATLDIPFNATLLAGTDVVVYELLIADCSIVAAHTDVDSDTQTVSIIGSSIDTSAADKTDGDRFLSPSGQATVIDTVSFSRLIPGKEYLLRGTLMDKASGTPFAINGTPLESEVRFTPNAPEGSVEVAFSFDAAQAAGRTLVVFEELSKDGAVVATHADLGDVAQTVTVTQEPLFAHLAQTGDRMRVLVAAAFATALVSAAALCAPHLRRHLERRRKLAVPR